MARRLSVKHRKTRRNKATAYKLHGAPKKHKVAEERSVKAKKKNANRA